MAVEEPPRQSTGSPSRTSGVSSESRSLSAHLAPTSAGRAEHPQRAGGVEGRSAGARRLPVNEVA